MIALPKRRRVNWAMVGVGAVAICGVVVVLLTVGGEHAPKAAAQTSANPPDAGRQVEDQQAVPVRTIQPTRENLQRTTTQAAQVEPYEKADIFAKASGYLEKVHVDIGDRVKKDQVLAELWIPEMEQQRLQKEALVEKARTDLGKAEAVLGAAVAMTAAAQTKVEQAQADIGRHEGELAYRKGEYERYQDLVNERAVRKELADEKLNQLRAAEAALDVAKRTVASAQADAKVDEAKLAGARAEVASAKAGLRVASANLEQTSILLNYSRIRAPYDGVVTRRLVDTGAFIQSAVAGQQPPLFTVMRVDRLRIVSDAPEADSAWITIGQPATLRVDALRGRQFSGKVVRVADSLDAETRTMRTEVELHTPAAGLRPGMFGSLTINLVDSPNAVLLPATALLVGGDKPSVMVADAGRARRREIGLGYNDGVRVQVTGGLNGDEQVITDGKNSLREGQPVRIAR